MDSVAETRQTPYPFNANRRDHEQPIASERVRVLAYRLDTGWALIDRDTDPVRRARLEEQWIGLLRAYETACDQVVTGESAVSL